ncbi:hypothetical protein [Microcystis aeruginosa]|uniref:Uncharacterized protein n=1 Tax=Microcystis aeruginosa Sj TaxID=1979544 RepID=A0A2Z6UM93_MICAE|nr:hypothetical protein [Microcystis aeruginosa]MDB9432038.1 hypothetical protein [Microcystis aeruginosa CS-552/01]GBL09456.1 hypothetical protein MSj_00935 [Microcystis aeruginosa Sj]
MSNLLWPRFLKKAYRQEPITSFIFTAAAVDVIIGVLGQRWTLLSLGATIMAIAIFARWQQVQKTEAINKEEAARYYLPPQSGQVALPTLKNEKNRPY